MPSCQKIDLKSFHSAEAHAYSERCVEKLMESPQFNKWTRHIAYRDRLYLTWFVVPLGLFFLFWYHLSVSKLEYIINTDIPIAETITQHFAEVPLLSALTVVVLGFLLPCSIVAPFTGFFEEPTAAEGLRTWLLLVLVHAGIISFGGEWFNYPPFLTTVPPLHWESSGLNWTTAARMLLVRTVPMQGYLAAGYAVSQWQRSSWRRMWHVPLPIVSVPLFVGLCGAGYAYLTGLVLPYMVISTGELTEAGKYSAGHVFSDPQGVLSLWYAIGEKVVATVHTDALAWLRSGELLPPVVSDSNSCAVLYLAAISLTTAYFFTQLLSPLVTYFASGLLLLLPTHPTTWGLSLLSAILALGYTTQMGMSLQVVAGLTVLIAALLYNGFIA